MHWGESQQDKRKQQQANNNRSTHCAPLCLLILFYCPFGMRRAGADLSGGSSLQSNVAGQLHYTLVIWKKLATGFVCRDSGKIRHAPGCRIAARL
jgi:hypothetical protein